MTYTIGDDSPKRAVALRFGNELRRVMTERKVSAKGLEAALGRSLHSSIHWWRAGRILPRLGVAAELAEALVAPQLLEIVREARTFACAHCGKTFTFDGGSGNKKYCTPGCASAAATRRRQLEAHEAAEARGYQNNDPDRVLVARLKQELHRVRGTTTAVSRKEVAAAIEQYEHTAPQGRLRRISNRLNVHMAAVEAFCHGCEPEGLCRDNECPLRAVSPLPFVPMADVDQAAQWHHGGNTPEARARGQARKSASLRAMYQREPERRVAHSRRSKSWWASLTPAERVEIGNRISEKRKGEPNRRACGCPNRRHDADCPLRNAA